MDAPRPHAVVPAEVAPPAAGAAGPGPLRVRPATAGDAAAVSAILAEALGAKYRPAFGRRAERALRFLALRDTGGASRVIVAEAGGAVAGAVRLALRPDEDAAFTERLVHEIGWLPAMRAVAVLSTLAPRRIAPGEAWVEELAVHRDHRRRGVARALLDACAEQAAAAGRTRLALWVTGENRGAIALYRASGFTVRERRRWPLGRLVFGADGALRMEKPLSA